jgi:hypothetical protein
MMIVLISLTHAQPPGQRGIGDRVDLLARRLQQVEMPCAHDLTLARDQGRDVFDA